MIFPDVPEFTVHGVFERGVPNKERIVLRARQDVEMSLFGLTIGLRVAPHLARPINNKFFWFGNGTVKNEEWIHLYTADGTPRMSHLEPSKAKVYILFWGSPSTLFSLSDLVPIFFRMDAATIERTVFPQIQ